jgi:hypothetical protein
VCVCVFVCVSACARACTRACVCVRESAYMRASVCDYARVGRGGGGGWVGGRGFALHIELRESFFESLNLTKL